MSANNQVTISQPLRLDIIAAETMGTEQNGCMEALLAANPGLSAGGPYIAEGTTVSAPPAPVVAPVPAVNPWN